MYHSLSVPPACPCRFRDRQALRVLRSSPAANPCDTSSPHSLAAACPGTAPRRGSSKACPPPVVEQGKTTRVTFVGHDLGPGLDMWHSLPKGALTAKPVRANRGQLVFDITAAADAPVGVCGRRLATRDGLTNAVLLHVEDLPVKGTSRVTTPVSLALPACVWGTFREGTLDRYTITVAAGREGELRGASRTGSARTRTRSSPSATQPASSSRSATTTPGCTSTSASNTPSRRPARTPSRCATPATRACEHHHYVLRVGKFPAERVAIPAWWRHRTALPGTVLPATEAARRRRFRVAAGRGRRRAVTVAKDFNEARDNALSQAISSPGPASRSCGRRYGRTRSSRSTGS